jgi:light-regulated signal transduction histidine kinase (bacteriophytochrome)
MPQTLPPASRGTAASEIRLQPGELQRLAECVLEPIRFPGAVQAHGVLLAMRRDDLVITHASENAAAVLGVEPVALFGRRLHELVGADAVAAVRDILDPTTISSNPLDLSVGGVPSSSGRTAPPSCGGSPGSIA